MNKTTLFILTIVIFGVFAGYYLLNKQKSASQPAITNEAQNTTSKKESVNPSEVKPTDASNTKVKEFKVVGANFSFDPKEIIVKKGDIVRIVFVNNEGFHDFVLDEFNMATKQLQVGGTEMVEFTADKAGKFEYYCSVGNHREMGMFGSFIVEE